MKSMYSSQFLTTVQNILKFLRRSGWILLMFSFFGIGYGVYKASKEIKQYETKFVGQAKESSAAVAVSLLNSLDGKKGQIIQLDKISMLEIEAKSQMTNLKNDSINIGGIEIRFRYSDSLDLINVASSLENFVNNEKVMHNMGDLIISRNFSSPISIKDGWSKNVLKNWLKLLMLGLAIALAVDLRNALKNHTVSE